MSAREQTPAQLLPPLPPSLSLATAHGVDAPPPSGGGGTDGGSRVLAVVGCTDGSVHVLDAATGAPACPKPKHAVLFGCPPRALTAAYTPTNNSPKPCVN